jgi:hypothetical protein
MTNIRNSPEDKAAGKKWYQSVKTWMLATALAATAAAVTTFATGAAGKLFDLGTEKFAGSPFKVSATRVKYCPYMYVIPGTAEAVAPAPDPFVDPDRVDQWAKERGGADGGDTQLEVTVTGSSEQQVVLHVIDVDIIDRGSPISGFQVGIVCGGPLPARFMSIDLDRRPPVVVQSVDARNEVGGSPDVTKKPITFPYVVSQSEAEVFYIFARTKDCNCTWRAKLRWASGGQSGQYIIDDNGEPFHTHKIVGYRYYGFHDPPLGR